MKRRAGFITRLERLEAQLEGRRFPRLIYGLSPEAGANEPTGYAANNITFICGSNETLADCAKRAFEATGAISLVAIYGPSPRQASPEREEGAQTSASTANAFEGPSALETGIAGIGRKASRAELIKMGVVPVPPERLT